MLRPLALLLMTLKDLHLLALGEPDEAHEGQLNVEVS